MPATCRIALVVVLLSTFLPNTVTGQLQLERNLFLGQFKDPATTVKKAPSKEGGCNGYSGVLQMSRVDAAAATGTVFFIYVVNHLIYAEDNNLMMWVHLDEGVGKVYDEQVHSGGETTFQMVRGIPIKSLVGEDGPPGRAEVDPNLYRFSEKETITVHGNGVWETYFRPVSGFDIADESCTSKPLFVFKHKQVYPGIHFCAEWAVR